MMDPGAQILAFLRRVFASDFRNEKPTAWDMYRMGAPGAAPRLAHSYTAWRSSLLYAATALLLFTSVWNLATYTSGEETILGVFRFLLGLLRQLGAQVPTEPGPALQGWASDNGPIIDVSGLTSRISALVAVLMVGGAAALWPRVRISILLARIAWLVLFGIPFVMALLPLSAMMDYGDVSPSAVPFFELLFGTAFGLTVFMGLLPKALSLFPGLVRSSMALKTLLPEHRTPGWITVLLAPLFCLFLWLLMATVNQFPETTAILIGVVFIMAGQVVYIVMAKHIVRAYDRLPAKVVWPRRLSAILGITGVLIIFFRLVTVDEADVGGTIAGFIGLFGNILLLSVVCSDFLLPLLRTGHNMTRSFVESPMYDQLGRKCEDVSLAVKATGAPQPPLETVQARAVDEQVQTVQAKPIDDDS
jgi:hypothetical protein